MKQSLAALTLVVAVGCGAGLLPSSGDAGTVSDAGTQDATSSSSSGGGSSESGPRDSGSCGTMCSGVCVDEQSDPKNCGGCGIACCVGLSCSQGTCVADCPAGDTLCAIDAGVGCAGGDPTCADLRNDPNNCGGCGIVCCSSLTCVGGWCTAGCPTGKKICMIEAGVGCSVNLTCIPLGACCATTDCTLTGETCPSPGDICQCPVGQTACSASSSCITSGTCCSNADCQDAGLACPTPGQPCR